MSSQKLVLIFLTILSMGYGRIFPSNSTERHRPMQPSFRISYGETKIFYTDVEFFVGLLEKPEWILPLYYYHCGGALLTERHVITAAHCINDGSNEAPYVGHRTFIETHHNALKWKNYKKIKAAFYVIHKKFKDKIKPDWDYDIGMVKLTEPIRSVSDSDFPILNTISLEKIYSKPYDLKLYGYGLTEAADEPSDDLLRMHVIIYNSTVQETDIPQYCYNREKFFCLRGPPKGPQGQFQEPNELDSGGPIVSYRNYKYKLSDSDESQERTEATLVGVLFGKSRHLPINNVGVANNVIYFRKWIDFVLTKFPDPDVGFIDDGVRNCCDKVDD